MSYLYQQEAMLCLLVLSACVLAFCIFIQWGKGTRVVSWILGTVGVGAIALGMLSPFAFGGRYAASGSAYALLAGVLAVMLNAARKLRTERRQAEEMRPS